MGELPYSAGDFVLHSRHTLVAARIGGGVVGAARARSSARAGNCGRTRSGGNANTDAAATRTGRLEERRFKFRVSSFGKARWQRRFKFRVSGLGKSHNRRDRVDRENVGGRLGRNLKLET
jgi:hypothetical protein